MKKALRSKTLIMKEFVLNCYDNGLSPKDIENLTKINPELYETYYSLFDKIRNKNIGIRAIRDWAKQIEKFEFISDNAVENLIYNDKQEKEMQARKMAEEEIAKAEKEKNIKEIWELATQLGISRADLFKGKA